MNTQDKCCCEFYHLGRKDECPCPVHCHTTQEEELKEVKGRTLLFTERNNRNAWGDFILGELRTTRQQAVEETEKAFGGCTNCYGKGYHTTKMAVAGRHFRKDLNPYIPCDKCDRGKQFTEAMEYAVEEERERVRKVVGGVELKWLDNAHPFKREAKEVCEYVFEETKNQILALLTTNESV